MKTVYKILNYEGPIHSISRWAQELLAYSFTCVHRPNSMMVDVDALSRSYDPLTAKHIVVANTYRVHDMNCRSDAYSTSMFDQLLSQNRYTLKPSAKRKRAACHSLIA